MIVTLNDPTPFAGKRMGDIVFYRFYDILCARRYVVPRDPGKRVPIHVTASGQALLARL